jgi:hypothetical protein
MKITPSQSKTGSQYFRNGLSFVFNAR